MEYVNNPEIESIAAAFHRDLDDLRNNSGDYYGAGNLLDPKIVALAEAERGEGHYDLLAVAGALYMNEDGVWNGDDDYRHLNRLDVRRHLLRETGSFYPDLMYACWVVDPTVFTAEELEAYDLPDWADADRLRASVYCLHWLERAAAQAGTANQSAKVHGGRTSDSCQPRQWTHDAPAYDPELAYFVAVPSGMSPHFELADVDTFEGFGGGLARCAWNDVDLFVPKPRDVTAHKLPRSSKRKVPGDEMTLYAFGNPEQPSDLLGMCWHTSTYRLTDEYRQSVTSIRDIRKTDSVSRAAE